MHDEDCHLPSLDWLTESQTKCDDSLVVPQFYDHHENQLMNKSIGNIDFSKEAIKPPYSYAQLITLAMRHHENCKVLLSDIYDYMKNNFAWYRRSDVTWQNSIRHNLSLNKQFVKLPRREGEKGKGSYWMLDPSIPDPFATRGKKTQSTQTKAKSIGTVPKLNPALLPYLKKCQLSHDASFDDQDHGDSMRVNTDKSYYFEQFESTPSSGLVDDDFFALDNVFDSNNCDDRQNFCEINDYLDQKIEERSPTLWKQNDCFNWQSLNDCEPHHTDAQISLSAFNDECLSSPAALQAHPWQELELKPIEDLFFFDLAT